VHRLLNIRKGERLRLIFMALYLLLVLFAYYTLRPVSRALFLKKFDIDSLPWLYIVIAAAGGAMAYLYTRIAVRSSLGTAVTTSMAAAIVVLVGFWSVLDRDVAWMLYAFEIFVKVLSILLVSQAWLVASNLFTSEEAKRVYGLLGISAVAGAAFGGSFTAAVVQMAGTLNLLLASALMIALAYVSFRFADRYSGRNLMSHNATEDMDRFSTAQVVDDVRSSRHLQVLIGIITLTYVIDVMVEYQWNAMARQTYTSEAELAAYFGAFQGIYTNVGTFVLFLLTGAVVRRFGVAGSLQVMPAAIMLSSAATFASPTALLTSMGRLTEAAMRYSFNRTGMELLYLPLPAVLRNRTKGLLDVFVDRMARGFGGILLLFLTSFLGFGIREISLVVAMLAVASMILIARAQAAYKATIRAKLPRTVTVDLTRTIPEYESGPVDRGRVEQLILQLQDKDCRPGAIEALGQIGTRIIGTLEDVLADTRLPVAIRAQAPSVLALIGSQRVADVLVASLGHPEPAIRAAIIHALNTLRDSQPSLEYDAEAVHAQIRAEIRTGFQFRVYAAAFNGRGTKASALMARALEARTRHSINGVFRLLALLHPPDEIGAVQAALDSGSAEQRSAAIDLLDTTLSFRIKRILLPLLDTEHDGVEAARRLFAIQAVSCEEAVRAVLWTEGNAQLHYASAAESA
jgi:AAA family ATP:ADP antiporter